MSSEMNAAAYSHYRDQFARLEPQLAGANLPWLRNARREAFDRFAELGFPTTRHEDWKYTNVASIEKRAFMSPAASNGVDAAQVNALALAGAHRLVFVNGRYDAAARTSTSRPVWRSTSRFTCCSSARKPIREFMCER